MTIERQDNGHGRPEAEQGDINTTSGKTEVLGPESFR